MSHENSEDLCAFDLSCDYEAGDWLEVIPVGPNGNPKSRLALSTLVANPDVEADTGDDVMIKGSIIMTPASARQLAVALLDFADQLDGLETSLLGSFDVGDLNE